MPSVRSSGLGVASGNRARIATAHAFRSHSLSCSHAVLEHLSLGETKEGPEAVAAEKKAHASSSLAWASVAMVLVGAAVTVVFVEAAERGK